LEFGIWIVDCALKKGEIRCHTDCSIIKIQNLKSKI
jgi:hypothetical protein